MNHNEIDNVIVENFSRRRIKILMNPTEIMQAMLLFFLVCQLSQRARGLAMRNFQANASTNQLVTSH